jgi:hypothetical protein
MKKLVFTIMFLISSIYLHSQPYRLGINANILTGNEYLNYEIGPSVSLDYRFKHIPFSITGNAIFTLSELSNKNNLSTGFTRTVFSLGIKVNYYPVTWVIEPYIGLGAFYNFNNINSSGTLSPSSDGIIRAPNNLKNNLSSEITGGLNFSANSSINFIFEIANTFNKPSYDLKTIDTKGEKYITTFSKETFDFNSIFIKLGLYFKI